MTQSTIRIETSTSPLLFIYINDRKLQTTSRLSRGLLSVHPWFISTSLYI